MKTIRLLNLTTSLLATCSALLFPSPLNAQDSTAARTVFADPPREYSTGPLWVWNDMLTEEQIRETLRDMAAQNVRQVFVHPRPGLMTPYLSDDWFRLWKVALDEAEKRDMNVWIYDENSYPSGFAGGWVPELLPESRGRGLHFRTTEHPPRESESLLSVFQLEGEEPKDVTALLKAGAALPRGRYLAAEVRRAHNSPWHGNRSYVDLLYPGVTETFLEVTLEAYRREIGDHFGDRVPGVFTDEPQLRPSGGLPWTPDLAEQFEKRQGYPLMDHLAALATPSGDWKKVRHNYFQTVLELFIERWARPYYEWCDDNNLEFTGHYWEHEWPNCSGVPDNMALAAWQQRPGIDCLMNRYEEHNRAQFGNVRACREISSIANQLGRPRTLVEIYGAGGWDLRFEDMKRIGDWLQVLGVNTMNEHLSYITLRGARKRDHPQSFSYHEPWWPAYHVQADYLTRLSAALTQGQQINRILVLEPTTTLWMYQGHEKEVQAIGDAFFNLLLALESAQIEYDLGCEQVMGDHGSVEGDELRIGQRTYHTFILPPGTENLNPATWKLVQEFCRGGGTLLNGGAASALRHGGTLIPPDDALAALASTWPQTDAQDLPGRLAGRQAKEEGFQIRRNSGDKGILFHHRRQLEDGQLLLLVNTSEDFDSSGLLESVLQGVEQWDPYTGNIESYPFAPLSDGGVRASFHLPPSGSLLLFLSTAPRPPRATPLESVTVIEATGPSSLARLAPNVLTLDYVDVRAGNEFRQGLYFYAANQFVWQQNGMDRNPWDSAVQFKEELISRTFPPDSGFEASYRFKIEGAVPPDLAIVIERPDLYSITCNGAPLIATSDQWWLDKSFGKIALSEAAQSGDNVVTLKASPFTMFHELESVYVLGSFSLKPAEQGFVIAADHPLHIQAGPSPSPTVHGVHPDHAMWLTQGIENAPETKSQRPFVVFDLGEATDLAGIEIWNYNENHIRDLTGRGAHQIRITGSASSRPESFDLDLGTFHLRKAPGIPAAPERLALNAPGIRLVKIEILSNHYGVQYPPVTPPQDNGYVGLAEVRFLTGNNPPAADVTVRQFSSELTSHSRRAENLVDLSGLEPQGRSGWNHQGHPFYADRVAYVRQFEVEDLRGKFVLQLGDWRGSVAEVRINDTPAGYLLSPPWQRDVTEHLRPGKNTVKVIVTGTLKNTLGPHHNGPGLGSAWPSMFQRGPQPGPPPGPQYHTVGYGLFEEFQLRRVINEP